MDIDDAPYSFEDQLFLATPFVARHTFEIRFEILGQVNHGLGHR